MSLRHGKRRCLSPRLNRDSAKGVVDRLIKQVQKEVELRPGRGQVCGDLEADALISVAVK
jgi:hypothetical protein